MRALNDAHADVFAPPTVDMLADALRAEIENRLDHLISWWPDPGEHRGFVRWAYLSPEGIDRLVVIVATDLLEVWSPTWLAQQRRAGAVGGSRSRRGATWSDEHVLDLVEAQGAAQARGERGSAAEMAALFGWSERTILRMRARARALAEEQNARSTDSELERAFSHARSPIERRTTVRTDERSTDDDRSTMRDMPGRPAVDRGRARRGQTLSAVARQFGISRGALRNHLREHANPAVREAIGGRLEFSVATVVDRIADVADRAREQADAAIESGNVRAAVAAGDGELRALLVLRSGGITSGDVLAELRQLKAFTAAVVTAARKRPAIAVALLPAMRDVGLAEDLLDLVPQIKNPTKEIE